MSEEVERVSTWRGGNRSINIKEIKSGKTSRIKHYLAQKLVDAGTHVYISSTEYKKANLPVLTPAKPEVEPKAKGERVRRGKKGKKRE